MAVTGMYSESLSEEVVEVLEVNAIGARCRTSYKSEISIRWGSNLPSPVPQVGDVWRAKRIYGSLWSFDQKLTTGGYNFMRYAMSLDIRTCIGRERPVVDDIARSGVRELYITVAEDGVLYWDSPSAEQFGLSTYPGGCLRQVIDRCEAAGISVVLVIDCGLWSDPTDDVHRYYRQRRMDESYALGTWAALLDYEWGDMSQVTWRDVLESSWGDSTSSSDTWSFVTAKRPVRIFASELYELYGERVRGICFDGWRGDGGFADVSDYVNGIYRERYGRDIYYDMAADVYSDEWLSRRSDMLDMFGSLQSEFLSAVSDEVPGWPVSAIIPSQAIFQSSARSGRFDTWIDDDFGSYGWSMVGCRMDYVRSADASDEMRSFEYGVAYLRRLADGASPLFMLDIEGGVDYSGMLSILAKYDATNIIIGSYEDWRMLSDYDVIRLSDAMNAYSVTPKSALDDIGFYISNDSRDAAFFDEREPNRFSDAASSMAGLMLDKMPHRLRVMFDGDLARVAGGDIGGVSAIVVFEAENMSDSEVDAVSSLLGGSIGVTFVGMCGRYDEWSLSQRYDMPFLIHFGERDYGTMMYRDSVRLSMPQMGIPDGIYSISGAVEGARLSITDVADAAAVGYDDGGVSVAVPILSKGRDSIIALDVVGNDVLADLSSDLACYSVGRDA